MNTSPAPWTCPNCDQRVETRFCPGCGEKPLKPRDLQLRGLLGKLLHSLTSVDGKLLRTFARLVRYPGRLTGDYLAGARTPYIAPLQLFFIANVLFFGVQSLTHTSIFGATLDSHIHHQDWSAFANALVTERLQRSGTSLAAYAPVFDRVVLLNAKSLVILMVLPFALLTWLASAGSRKPFSAHVVFSLHLYTFLLLVFCVDLLLAGASRLMGGPGVESSAMDNALSLVNLLACMAYLGLALKPVYGGSAASLAARAVVMAVASGALVLGYRFVLFLITVYATT